MVNTTDAYTEIVFDDGVLDAPPESSHYMAWLPGHEEEPLSIFFDPLDYLHQPCRLCQQEKCWIPERECLTEFTHSHPNMVYEHACCCACHDTDRHGRKWDDDADEVCEYVDYGEDDDEDDDVGDKDYDPGEDSV